MDGVDEIAKIWNSSVFSTKIQIKTMSSHKIQRMVYSMTDIIVS